MTLIRQTTKVSELITYAMRDKSISVLEIPADLANAKPLAILITATGYYDIQLLLDAARPVTDIYGHHNGVMTLRMMPFNITNLLPGMAAFNAFVFRDLLEKATAADKILLIAFEPWVVHRMPAALVIAAAGRRYVDLLKDRVKEALETEKKLKEDKALTGYKDLPGDFLPKGEG